MDFYIAIVGKRVGSPDIDFAKPSESFSEICDFAKEHSLQWSRVYGVKYFNEQPLYYLLKVYTHNKCTFSEDLIDGEFY